jgi:hypothetical protein
MCQKHENKADRPLVVVSIQIFLISNSCSFLSFNVTKLKILKITSFDILFTMKAMVFSITDELRYIHGHAFFHRVYIMHSNADHNVPKKSVGGEGSILDRA